MGVRGCNRISAGAIVLALMAAGAACLAPAAYASSFGGFAEPLYANAGSGSDVATADFNGDADPDLALLDPYNVSILLGTGGGSFGSSTEFQVGGGSAHMAVGDFNGDSDPDLAVANSYGTYDVSILVGGAGGSFSSHRVYVGGYFGPPGYVDGNGPYDIAVGDFNGDSDPDLAIARAFHGVAVLLGADGAGFVGPYEFLTATSGSLSIGGPWLVVGDFNSDSDPDIVIRFSDNTAIEMLPGGPGGSFGAPTSFDIGASSSVSGVVGYFNADKNLDLATWVSGGLAVLLGNGNGSFAPPKVVPTSFRGYLAVGRFDRNSHPDLAIGGMNIDRDGGISVLLGDSKGDFVETTNFFTGGFGSSPAVAADFNGDSRDDLATVGTFQGAPGNIAIRLQIKGKP